MDAVGSTYSEQLLIEIARNHWRNLKNYFSLTQQDPFSISSFSDIIATEPCCSLIGIQLPNEPGSSTLQLRIPVNNTLQYHAAKNTRQRDDHHSQ